MVTSRNRLDNNTTLPWLQTINRLDNNTLPWLQPETG